MNGRKEEHTRSAFAYEKAEYWFKKMKHCTRGAGGNILSSKATLKFLQAHRIYNHYCCEFQNRIGIPEQLKRK